MRYNFDTTPDHRHNGSYRWNMPGMPEDIIGMGTADLDFYCAPCIREALLPVAEENCYNYRQRSDAYYDALCGWYKRMFDLDVRREWVSNVPSTIGAVRVALGIFAKPGDAVLVQTPVFRPIVWAIEGADLKQVDSPLKPVDGHYEIDFEDFENKLRVHRPKVFLLVNPHNPTGRVFTRQELERMVDLCAKYGVTLISDEVHGLIVYEDNRFLPILSIGEKARDISVQIMSFSKGYNIMSLPHAIITIANPQMQQVWLRQIQAHSFGYATNSFAITAVTAILEGKADDWMKELTQYLYNNLREALSFIEEKRLPLIPYKPEGSFLLWLDCRQAGIGEEHLDRFFRDETGIDLDDGEENFGPRGRGFVRINFAVPNKTLKEALARIERALQHNTSND